MTDDTIAKRYDSTKAERQECCDEMRECFDFLLSVVLNEDSDPQDRWNAIQALSRAMPRLRAGIAKLYQVHDAARAESETNPELS